MREWTYHQNPNQRDGKWGECDDCGEEGPLALTSEGWFCSDCLTPELLAEVLDLAHRGEKGE